MDERCRSRGAHGGPRGSTRTRAAASERRARIDRLDLQDDPPNRRGARPKDDLDTIPNVAKRGAGTTICPSNDGAVGPYISYIEKFRAEFEALIPHA